ncbi:hypothetical protein B488_13340 [Liberibacter crescens BT-1]|uniref:Outer membrane protein n=1 Tax=Liberibacter crescens (strain BT-1) TaxID=1215343 RepID=L0EY64_LIBCB|nr:SIMPL domain-containing protein [Liberibacter crescens]AGA65326.1 hypothetical protein B488_13340 [Liberibacter crescens BT-1]AMC13255.1 hypothetical protein RL73_06750 [Liberibacter crescens]
MRLNNKLSLITALLIFLVIVKIEPAFSKNTSDNIRTITVIGTGESSVSPDIAILHLTVIRQEKSVIKASNHVTKTTNSFLEMLKNKGIDKKEITSTDFSIDPLYNDKGIITGYNVKHSLKVNVYDMNAIGEILDLGISLGFNSSYDIEFTNKNMSDILNETYKKAVTAAVNKAKLLTEAAGAHLIKVREIHEVNESIPPIYNLRTLSASQDREPMKISSGQSTYSKTIQITFDID